MHKKLFSILLTVALVGGLLSVSQIALAQDTNMTGNPPASYLPDAGAGDWGTDVSDSNVLSDRSDGTDSLAHLTVVADAETQQVTWYACPQDVQAQDADTVNLSNAELQSCDVTIGSDNTPNTPSAGGGFAGGSDAAFDVFWNVPQQLDGDQIDVVAIECLDQSTPNPDSTSRCRYSVEEDITVDDAQSGTGAGATQTTAAEMVSICTADVTADGPDDTSGSLVTDPCNFAGVTNSTEAAQVAGRFKPFEHGDPVPDNGFVIRVTTSPDLLADGDLRGSREFGPTNPDADQDPDTSDQDVDCTVISHTTSLSTYECSFPDDGTTDDDTGGQAVWVYNDLGGNGAGEGFCDGSNPNAVAGNCTLDSHWGFASERAASSIVATFLDDPSQPTPAPDTDCATPDKEETNTIGDEEDILVCVNDQFGDPFETLGAEGVTLESSGVGEFEDCDGVMHDHNGDGLNEHCHGDTDADGEFEATIDNDPTAPEGTTGDQTVVACVENEIGGGAGSGNPAPSGHGCANEDVKDTLLKHWQSFPSSVFLVWAGTGDAADPCHTGDTNKENAVGDQDQLLACTFDAAGNPASTQPAGAGRLQWTIVPAGGGEVTATRFVGSPPSDTGADGTATATVEAFRPGNDFITVSLFDDTNAFLGGSTVQKRVTGRGETQCSDSVDNDGDGKVDLQDPGCSSAADDSESPDPGGGGDGFPGPGEQGFHGSTITIRYDANDRGGIFKGQVSSSTRKCKKGRTVVLKKKRPGRDRTVGRDSTNRAGNWKVREPNAKGKFYAKVKQKHYTKANGAKQTCGRDKSVTIKI